MSEKVRSREGTAIPVGSGEPDRHQDPVGHQDQDSHPESIQASEPARSRGPDRSRDSLPVATPDHEAAHPACAYSGCDRTPEKDSNHCLFHMPGAEKDARELWDKCLQRFHKKLVIGEGDFAGFVLKEVDLAGKTIEHDLNFTGALFIGPTVFSGGIRESTQFKGQVILAEATFQGDLDLSWAQFHDQTDFTGALFKGVIGLRGAVFEAHSKFNGMRCEKEADLRECVFEEHALFKAAHFAINGNFSSASFDKGGSFDRSFFARGNFEDASIQNVSYRQVALDHVRFAGAQMENAYLSDAWWSAAPARSSLQKLVHTLSVADPRFVIHEEEEANRIPDDRSKDRIHALLQAESTYRRLKHTHTNEGDYNRAGEFHIHEMRMKHHRYRLQQGASVKWKLFWNSFYNISCGYGERPKQLVLNALLIILLFTGLFHASDGVAHSNSDDAEFAAYDPTIDECLYFSVVTFTTLGYGDYSPKDDYRFFAALEAFTGAFTIALSVLVFGRKMMR